MMTALGLVVLVAVVTGVAVSRRHRRLSPAVEEVLCRPVLPALGALSPEELASVVQTVMRRDGYRVGRSHDDRPFRAWRADGCLVLVHCRAWRHALVGCNEVTALAEAVRRAGAGEGVLVSCGAFSECAVQAASIHAIRLLDGGAVIRRLQAL